MKKLAIFFRESGIMRTSRSYITAGSWLARQAMNRLR